MCVEVAVNTAVDEAAVVDVPLGGAEAGGCGVSKTRAR